MKRGQIQIIFTWIFILVLAGAILVYGVKFIRSTQELGEDVIISNFFQNLNDKIQLYYSLDIDTTSIEKFKLTNKIKYVCFTKDESFSGVPGLSQKNKDYMNSLKQYDNVFVIPPIGRENRINISRLDLEDNLICIDVVGGILNLRLTTTVGGVSVSS